MRFGLGDKVQTVMRTTPTVRGYVGGDILVRRRPRVIDLLVDGCRATCIAVELVTLGQVSDPKVGWEVYKPDWTQGM